MTTTVLLTTAHRSVRAAALACAVGTLVTASAAGASTPAAGPGAPSAEPAAVQLADQVVSPALAQTASPADVATTTTTAAAAAVTTTTAATTTTSARLTWAPPVLDDPTTVLLSPSRTTLKLDKTRDYVVVLPTTPLVVPNGITIYGGHDVVLIGGEVETQGRGLYLRDQTGTVHVEGVRLSGPGATEGINLDQRLGATVQLQNIAVETVTGSYSGHHADVLQTWAGPEVLRVDRVEGSSTYQGFFLDPHKFHADSPELFDIRNTVLRDSGDTSAYLLWQSGTFPITTRDVVVVPSARRSFPGQVLWVKGGQQSWSGVSKGDASTPSPLVGRPGTGYTSPGYADAGPPPTGDGGTGPAQGGSQTLTGTLVRAQGRAAGAGGAPEVELAWLHTASASVPVDPGPVSAVPGGSTVRLTLTEGDVGSTLEVLGVEVLSGAPDAAATGERSVTVVQVAPAGTEPDATPLGDVVGAVQDVAADYWSEQSGGALSLTAAGVPGWVRSEEECRSGAALWDDVAAQIGWQGGPDRHLLLVLPASAASLPGCYAGLATVGTASTYGGRASVVGTAGTTHELGHNLGLGHADALRCDATTEGPLGAGTTTGTGSCVVQARGDRYDPMGSSGAALASLSAPHADRLGLLPAADQVAVSTPTTVELRAVSDLTGTRALRLVDGDVTYWVELRAARGRDAFLSGDPGSLRPGLLLRREERAGGHRTLLLDPTPSSSSQWPGDDDSTLPVGTAAVLGSGRFTVSLTAVSGAGAVVSVAVDGRWPAGVAVPELQMTAPAQGSALPVGPVTVSGIGTAPEGTLRYQVTSGAGAVVAEGFATAGAQGRVGPWAFRLALPRGSYTVAVWVGDDSDGEGGSTPRSQEVRRSFTVT